MTDEVTWFVVIALSATLLLNLVAIARVRVWNPSRELRPGQAEQDEDASIWGVEHDLAQDANAADEQARDRHVDARIEAAQREPAGGSGTIPILWREICTWAYGRKVLIIRLVYLLLFAMAWAAVHWAVQSELAAGPRDEFATFLPAATMPLAFFGLVSLVIVNALGRDIDHERAGWSGARPAAGHRSVSAGVCVGQAGRRLLGHQGDGRASHAAVRLPLVVRRGPSRKPLFLLGGLVTMNIFVASLGVHCGMTYANSRTRSASVWGRCSFCSWVWRPA